MWIRPRPSNRSTTARPEEKPAASASSSASAPAIVWPPTCWPSRASSVVPRISQAAAVVRRVEGPVLDRPGVRGELRPPHGLEVEHSADAVPDHRLAEVWADNGAAVDDRRVGDRELEWAHLERSLADRQVDGLALVPRGA